MGCKGEKKIFNFKRKIDWCVAKKNKTVEVVKTSKKHHEKNDKHRVSFVYFCSAVFCFNCESFCIVFFKYPRIFQSVRSQIRLSRVSITLMCRKARLAETCPSRGVLKTPRECLGVPTPTRLLSATPVICHLSPLSLLTVTSHFGALLLIVLRTHCSVVETIAVLLAPLQPDQQELKPH